MSALTELNKGISACRKCSIASLRTKTVPGEGTDNAQILFVGEAPGWHEDQQGRPFVGPSGKLLDSLLASINLKRENVFIANVIKCRPPDNRDPLPEEIANCRPWLDKQMEIIKPQMVVTLGRFSMGMFFPGKTISRIHGTATQQDGVTYFAMYHPAAALHQGNLRQVLEADMKKLPGILAQIEREKAKAAEPAPPAKAAEEAQQIKMF